jgi:hypothetical protein
MTDSIPIVVDLDGTLVRQDTLYVHAWQLLVKKPWACILLPVKLSKGKAAMKQFMSRSLNFDSSQLSFHQELCAWLKDQKHLGREIILCTASSQQVADIVAQQAGFFDRVIGSGKKINLSGSRKANLLVKEFGERQFDYCGNAPIDLEVWEHANQAIVVNANTQLAEQAAKFCPVAKVFD